MVEKVCHHTLWPWQINGPEAGKERESPYEQQLCHLQRQHRSGSPLMIDMVDCRLVVGDTTTCLPLKYGRNLWTCQMYGTKLEHICVLSFSVLFRAGPEHRPASLTNMEGPALACIGASAACMHLVKTRGARDDRMGAP